jgi:hypothetical protein
LGNAHPLSEVSNSDLRVHRRCGKVRLSDTDFPGIAGQSALPFTRQGFCVLVGAGARYPPRESASRIVPGIHTGVEGVVYSAPWPRHLGRSVTKTETPGRKSELV